MMPITTEQYERSLEQPRLCEQLKVRDLCDNLLIQLNGSFVAGYRVSGCDANVYPPMSEQLQSLGIDLVEGFGEEQLAHKPDR